MNFLKGTLKTSGGVSFDCNGVRVPLEGYAFASAPADGQPAELGIRPEHIETGGSLQAQIEMAEPMGSDQLAWLRLGGAPLSLRLPAEAEVKAGETMPLAFPARRLSLFDAASGQRL